MQASLIDNLNRGLLFRLCVGAAVYSVEMGDWHQGYPARGGEEGSGVDMTIDA